MANFEPVLNLEFLDHLEEGIYILDPNRKILFWNRAAERITGYSRQEVLGYSCKDNILIHVDDQGHNLCKKDCPVIPTLAEGKCHEALVSLHHKEGHRLPVSIKLLPLKDAQGKIVGAIELFENRSLPFEDLEELFMEQGRQEFSFADRVTGFFSQSLMKVKLKTVHSEMSAMKKDYGIIVITFRNFSDILLQFGDRKSEESVRVISKTIHALSRTPYLLGRWNEYTFVVAVPEIRENAVKLIALRYQHIINSASLTVDTGEIGIQVKADILMPNVEETVESALEQIDRLACRD